MWPNDNVTGARLPESEERGKFPVLPLIEGNEVVDTIRSLDPCLRKDTKVIEPVCRWYPYGRNPRLGMLVRNFDSMDLKKEICCCR